MKKLKWLFGFCLMVLVVCGNGVSVKAYWLTHVTDDGIQYEENTDSGEILITSYQGENETVVIPSEIDGKPVISVWGGFFDTQVIKHCIIPEGIYEIFSDTTWMFRVIGETTSLETVSLPSTLKTIGDGAFAKCCNLSNITLPDGLTDIGDGAFADCTFKEIIIPDSAVNIHSGAFFNIYDRITICANSDSYARTYANKEGMKFRCLNPHNWNKGAITTKPTAIKDGVKTFTCTACKTKRTEKVAKLGLPKKGNNITDTKSKNTYKVTKSAAKNGTVELTKVSKSQNSITVPDTVTVDGVTYKVTSISKNVFKNNKKMKKVTIGKNVKTIGANAFYGCKNLKTVTVKSTQLKTVGKNTFKGIYAKAKIKVPKSKLSSYKNLLAKKGQKSTVEITK